MNNKIIQNVNFKIQSLCLTFYLLVIVAMPSANGDTFKISDQVSLRYSDKSFSFVFQIDGVDNPVRTMPSHWNFHGNPKSTKIKVDPVKKNLTLQGTFTDKGKEEEVSHFQTIMQFENGTNASIHTEFTYLQEVSSQKNAFQSIYFDTANMPANTSILIHFNDGKEKNFHVKTQEVTLIKDPVGDCRIKDLKSVEIHCGKLFASIAPSTESELTLEDARVKDQSRQWIVLSISSKKRGIFRQGEKAAFETLLVLKRNIEQATVQGKK